MEALLMHWRGRNISKAVVVFAVILLLFLSVIVLPPLIGGGQTEQTIQFPGGGVPATPTINVTAVVQDQLKQQDEQLQRANSQPWIILNPLFSSIGGIGTICLAIVAFLTFRSGFKQWQGNRQDDQEKRAEERFQAAVTGLGGDDKAGIGATAILRTFLREGYEQYYRQVFDLAVGYLRLRPIDPENAEKLDPLSQALIGVFVESFKRAREYLLSTINLDETLRIDVQLEKYLNATYIQLDKALLKESDLNHIWIPEACLRKANLRRIYLEGAYLHTSDLRGADLTDAHLRNANLPSADLRGANLSGADLRQANLFRAKLAEANLSAADMRQAQLYNTNIEAALSLKDTDLRGVEGLTDAQLEACRRMEAIVDDDTTVSSTQSSSASTQSNDAQAVAIPPAQENTSAPDTDGSSAPTTSSTQPGS
jgi:uncharacterized protein YjbI with pentapeptide repeats